MRIKLSNINIKIAKQKKRVNLSAYTQKQPYKFNIENGKKAKIFSFLVFLIYLE
jgi:hypothetical protein